MGAKVIKVDMRGVGSKINRIKTNKGFGTYAYMQLAKKLQPYVPEREGILKGAISNSKPWLLVYSTPYARYQYNGVSKGGKTLHYSKPTASSKWDKKLNKAEFVRTLTEYARSM